MFYLRLTGTAKEIYSELEPYYSDYRKLRLLTPEGWSIIHMDEFVDLLLEKETIYAEDIERILGPAAQVPREDDDPKKGVVVADDDAASGTAAPCHLGRAFWKTS